MRTGMRGVELIKIVELFGAAKIYKAVIGKSKFDQDSHFVPCDVQFAKSMKYVSLSRAHPISALVVQLMPFE